MSGDGAKSEPKRRGREPDFLGIGAQKAGTTSVAVYLRRHPDVWVPPVKELRFFDDAWGDGRARPRERTRRHKLTGAFASIRRELAHTRQTGAAWSDLRWLARYYLGRPSDRWYLGLFGGCSESVCGEITPRYSMLGPEEVARVKSLLPRVRIFFTLRHPIERAWSHLRYTAERMSESEMIAFIERDQQHGRSAYVRTLEVWEKHFPAPEQLLVLFYEDLQRDPRGYMEALCGFLGVDPAGLDPSLLAQQFNVSRTAEMPPGVKAHLERKYRPMMEQLAERFPRVEQLWELD